ncbi:glycosyltransferase family 4 protein [Clostridium chauvoei]|uniref:glycosyltransferase family 4 protein n=1 Tax=Clostridium chauvoei TaxID=46867 RepID=UPI001C84F11F|nr:glycosyltransferase family 4 protein [Clostridium chauvoei]MBX7327724.1 glycosyltransferase family 4 protein [Clostridium chauvoei]
MEKVLFYDYNIVGHHWDYDYFTMMNMNGIEKVYYSIDLDDEKKYKLKKSKIEHIEGKRVSNNKFKRILDFLINIRKVKKYCKNNNISRIHFFTLDYMLIPISILFWGNKYKLTGTIHWIPKQNIKYKIIRHLITSTGFKIIVHGDYIKNSMESRLELKTNNINSTNYPIIENNKFKELSYNKLNEDITILYFGGTRYDKGIDILIEAIKNIDKKINLIIAGKEEYFSKEYICEKISKNKNINCILDMKYISDEEMDKYYKISDVVVLPYRKIFGGQSGILTEAINYEKVLIAPDIAQLGETVKSNDIGILYQCENVIDLNEKINFVIDNYEEIRSRYIENQRNYKKIATFKNLSSDYMNLIIKE